MSREVMPCRVRSRASLLQMHGSEFVHVATTSSHRTEAAGLL